MVRGRGLLACCHSKHTLFVNHNNCLCGSVISPHNRWYRIPRPQSSVLWQRHMGHGVRGWRRFSTAIAVSIGRETIPVQC
ncbi:hypothetical protein [Haloarcula salinisoli]|uniref:hypothetical protein n=1 Tax=Haloarcula salinisoli TaxID=2487746 RepID=UPI0039A41F6B